MDLLSDLASPIIIGILLGGLYVVVALGLSLLIVVTKMINVAHGTLVILGSYLAFALLSTFGIDPILGLVIGIPAFFLMGILLEKFLLNRAVKMSADAALIIAFGIALVVQNAMQIIWTPMSRSLVTDYSFESLQIGNLYIPVVYILDFAAALVGRVVTQ